MTEVDADTGEVVGSATAIAELIEVDDTWAAARVPAFRVWTEGARPGITVLGDGDDSVVLTDRPDGTRALLGVATGQMPVALAVWLGLRPRRAPGLPVIRLDPGAMSVVIGRGEAHGHGLEPEVANELQRRLDAGVRHWTVCVQRGGWRRNLEVLEGDGGIWRVRPVGELVELAPTTTTAVVRELLALLAEATRREDRPAAP
jgi:hypothetical protein